MRCQRVGKWGLWPAGRCLVQDSVDVILQHQTFGSGSSSRVPRQGVRCLVFDAGDVNHPEAVQESFLLQVS